MVRAAAMSHISRLAGRVPSHGRARQASTSTSGYSSTVSNTAGAIRAVKAPPTTPPNDMSR